MSNIDNIIFNDGDTFKKIREGANQIHKSLADRVKALEEAGPGESVPGPAGPAGADGETPHIDSKTGNWFIGTVDTGVKAQGPVGPSGVDGKDGPKGDKGSVWYTGEGIPSSEQGVAGDFYLDGDTGDVYEKMGVNWEKKANIKGPAGEAGSTPSPSVKSDVYWIDYEDGTELSEEAKAGLKDAIKNKMVVLVRYSDELSYQSVKNEVTPDGGVNLYTIQYNQDGKPEIVKTDLTGPMAQTSTELMDAETLKGIQQETEKNTSYDIGWNISTDTPTSEQFDNLKGAIENGQEIKSTVNLTGTNELSSVTSYSLASVNTDGEGEHIYLYHIDTHENKIVLEGVRYHRDLEGNITVEKYINEAATAEDLSKLEGKIGTIEELVAGITTGKTSLKKVESLPDTGEGNIIYLVPKSGTINDIYDEFIWIDEQWEKIGSTSVELSDYYDSETVDALLDTKANKQDEQLETENKTLVGAINELNARPSGGGSDGSVRIYNQLEYALDYDLPDSKIGDINIGIGTEQIGATLQDYVIMDRSGNILSDKLTEIGDIPGSDNQFYRVGFGENVKYLNHIANISYINGTLQIKSLIDTSNEAFVCYDKIFIKESETQLIGYTIHGISIDETPSVTIDIPDVSIKYAYRNSSDGNKYIIATYANTLRIYKAVNSETELVKEIELTTSDVRTVDLIGYDNSYLVFADTENLYVYVLDENFEVVNNYTYSILRDYFRLERVSLDVQNVSIIIHGSSSISNSNITYIFDISKQEFTKTEATSEVFEYSKRFNTYWVYIKQVDYKQKCAIANIYTSDESYIFADEADNIPSFYNAHAFRADNQLYLFISTLDFEGLYKFGTDCKVTKIDIVIDPNNYFQKEANLHYSILNN